MTFTDAEARIYEELGTTIRGEFQVTGIARTDLHDIFQYDDTETWFKCKVTYDRMDEEGEKAKTVSQNFLVSASNVKEAYERTVESLSTMMIDFVIASIVSSPIVEIFPYREEDVQSPAMKKIAVEDNIEERTPVRAVFSAAGSDFDDTEEEVFVADESEGDSTSELEDDFSNDEDE
jgi:hypothetical protein